MANFSRQFPSGFPFEGEIPSTWIEFIDSILTKIPNGTDGSSHAGTLTLGGVLTSHHRSKETTATQSTTGSVVYNANVTNSLTVACSPAAPITITLDFQNVAQGDRLCFVIVGNINHRVTLVWAGGGMSHTFMGDYEDQIVPYDGGFTIWEGLALTATTIYWKATRKTS
jgi:hypothetical protein